MDDAELRKRVLDQVIGLVNSFCFYDRVDDENLPRADFDRAYLTNVVTIDETAERFGVELAMALDRKHKPDKT